jgi:hypothetical protein
VFDIPSLYAELAGREYDGLKGASTGGRVSGSSERRLPIDTDAVDLTGPVRAGGVAVLDEDAVGHTSVASTLDFWVEDWRAERGSGERRPSATVPELARWLLDRLDDACDHGSAVVEFFEAVRRLHAALRHQLGQVDVPDYKRGVPCANPRCGALTLVHQPGADRIECGSCDALLSFLEYDDHVRALAAALAPVRRARVAKVKAVRRVVEALRGAGWRHGIDYASSGRDPDGAPDHEGYRIHRWRRSEEVIEYWTYFDGGAPCDSVWYAPIHDEPGIALSVSVDWVAANGIPALQRLARAAGILTPVKQKEAA